jgi:thiamine pyrophosphokinase
MSIQAYLDGFRDSKRISVVGPFADITVALVEPIIYVDGGAHFRRSTEGIAVGDGDSYDGKLDVSLNPAKDYSDLAYALAAIPENIIELQLLGFLGGRRDHELFNLGEVHHYLKSRTAPARASFDDQVIGFSQGTWEFSHQGCFSVAVIEEALVTIRGDCLYPCNQPTLFPPLNSLGLSNEAKGTILIESTGTVFVFLHGNQA